MNVLVLNAGSSSLKFQIIATDLNQINDCKDDRICRGEIESIGGEAILRIRYRAEPVRTLTAALHDMGAALDYLIRFLASDRSGIPEIKSSADVHAVGDLGEQPGDHELRRSDQEGSGRQEVNDER